VDSVLGFFKTLGLGGVFQAETEYDGKVLQK
jgi:hypothetical protein